MFLRAIALFLIYYNSMKRILLFVAILLIALPSLVHAQSGLGENTGFDTEPTTQEVRATITAVTTDELNDGQRHVVFEAKSSDGVEFTIDSANSFTAGIFIDLHEGQKVLLQTITYPDGTSDAFYVDIVRTNTLLWIFLLFALVTILIGTLRGALALVGLLVTVAILFGFIIPQIAGGSDPVITTVLGGIVILAVNMHLTHGLNRKTFMAFIGTVIGLGLVVIFSEAFVYFAGLSGMASEESALLFLTSESIMIPSGVLLAGIILGAVGVLDDIAVTQVETVTEIKAADPSLTNRDLFTRAMRVGRHHIASVVNTLVLAYAGVALPLFLLFYITPDMDILRFVNEELIAEEIIRTIAGTMGLVLLVPIATWLAIYPSFKDKKNSAKEN